MRLFAAAAEFPVPRSLDGAAGFENEIREAGLRGLKYLGLFSSCVPLAAAFIDLFTLPDVALAAPARNAAVRDARNRLSLFGGAGGGELPGLFARARGLP
jgi:hypothetical protein